MQTAETILNFQKILENVAQSFIFEMSTDYTDAYLKVEDTYAVVADLQRYTEAFYRNQESIGLPDLLPLHRFTVILQKLSAASMFAPKEALQVANLYDNALLVEQFYNNAGDSVFDAEQIAKLTEQLVANKPISKEIRRVITKDATIADDASPKLKTLRRDQRETEQSIRQTLQRLMQSEKTKLAENLYTIRNNRYVLPIKAEFKHTFSGILHDQSASGTTVYIEPQSLVNINNKLHQLAIEEAQEMELILRELSEKLFSVKDEITHNVNMLACFDIYQAKATYAYKNEMHKVSISDRQMIALYDAKHPLLQNVETIGNDILLGDGYNVLMITGANTGGKSVFLKTIGLLSLMAQAGLFLPVDANKDNKIGVFTNIFIDIGDEQSLEQNLSTFSGHIQNMKRILKHSDAQTLVLLDELGNGTDPLQGSALAIAMIEYLAKKQALVVGTTHFNEMKDFIMQAPFAMNAAMVFDVATLKPTYKMRYGSYGGSYAFDIAQALELPSDIIKNARAHAESFANDTSELMGAYEARLQELETRSEGLDAQARTLAAEEAALQARLASAAQEIEQERKTVIAQSEKELNKKIKTANTLLEEIKTKKALKQNEYADLKGQLNATSTKTGVTKAKQQTKQHTEPFAINDVVYLEQLQTNGTLVKKQGKKWLVKAGKLSLNLPEKELIFVKKGAKKQEEVKRVRKVMSSVSDTLDLRGFRVAEGIDTLETYLANAASSHKVVKIIHGHGTGQMRDAVQTVLRRTKSVKSFRFGGEGEGGVGATIVEFY